ncbi:MAG: hypothetical protein IJY25_03460 [Bacilli bacterium]|nr:hypothetical protein [Bacilli bacterium]
MNIKFINVDRKDAYQAYELIKKSLYSCKETSTPIVDAEFYHQIKMQRVPQVLKNGLFSKRKIAELEGRELTPHERSLYSDDGRVNGLDYISLSNMNLDFSKMGEKELYFDPFNTIEANIIVSKDINISRSTHNYFNEYLVKDRISPKQFNAIDTRILKILDFDFHDTEKNKLENRIQLMLEYYNYLRNIAITLKENKLDIPLREVSDEVITLNPKKVIRMPHFQLK